MALLSGLGWAGVGGQIGGRNAGLCSLCIDPIVLTPGRHLGAWKIGGGGEGSNGFLPSLSFATRGSEGE